MYSVCFIVAGMDKRISFMNECIKCFKASQYADCDIYCYWQGGRFDDVQGKEIFTNVIVDSKPRGVFTPRYELMKRFAWKYDYTILIDDDLFIRPETKYFDTIKFMREFPNVGAACALNVKGARKNKIEIASRNTCFNILGGMVFSKRAIRVILDYFSDKEQDYTFDCFWLLLYVKGFDLAKDFRSFATHKTAATQKINGEWTGFNWSRFNMPYIPFMTEYLNEPKFVMNEKRYGMERSIPCLKDINSAGLIEREKCKKDF